MHHGPSSPPILAATLMAVLLMLSSGAIAQSVVLPKIAPAPKLLTERLPLPEPAKGADAQATPPTVALPEQRPDQEPVAKAEEPPRAPEDIPIPETNPRKDDVPVDTAKPGAQKPAGPVQGPPMPMLADARSGDRANASGQMPDQERACRDRLRAAGVAFVNRPAEADAAIGCTIPYPIVVKSLGLGFGLKPDAVMNCAMAEASAHFMKDVVSPAAKAEYGSALASVAHASAFVCRPRNGTRKLSEHAFGNALDIATFKLADGTEIDVEPAPDEKAARFLGAVRKAACGPFKTVLGPGSDADHALHFHFDLAPRRNGGTFCQ